MGVGRGNQITGANLFGVRRETNGTSYGGMYVESSDAQGRLFYGYATNGNDEAWTCFEGSTGKWKLYNSGVKVTVQDDGNVGIGMTSPNSTLQVSGDYIQFPTRTGAPPASDCNASTEYGRVVVRTDSSTNLHVCTSAGWQGK